MNSTRFSTVSSTVNMNNPQSLHELENLVPRSDNVLGDCQIFWNVNINGWSLLTVEDPLELQHTLVYFLVSVSSSGVFLETSSNQSFWWHRVKHSNAFPQEWGISSHTVGQI